MRTCLLLVSALFGLVHGNDPSPGWLSYAVYTAPNEGKVTAVNTTWTVPSRPKRMFGSNAPGWWFGIQTTKGDGALVQPILAWDYHGEEYSIFNACFDWTDRSWHTSREVYTVKPGDKITSSISYREDDNSYDMYIEGGGQSITTNYKLERRQKAPETTVYFVLEHSPSNCEAYPESGVCTFENIAVEVDGKLVDAPEWEAKQETPKCNSKAAVVDSKTIKFTWDADAVAEPQDQCKKASYDFCCEVGTPCDCSKGVTTPGQCEQASYAFCCSVGVPCDCSQPPSAPKLPRKNALNRFASLEQLLRRVNSCPAGTTECQVNATKTMCCTKGEFCIKNVGCTCADGDCAAGPSKWSPKF